jgi:hypothetical protein
MSDIPPIEFQLNARTLCVPMKVQPPTIITRQPVGDVVLRGPQDTFYLKVPASEFPFLVPGANVLVALTIVKPEFGAVQNAQLVEPTKQ